MTDTNQNDALLATKEVAFGAVMVTVRELTLRQRKTFIAIVKEKGHDDGILWLCANGCNDIRAKGTTPDELDETYNSEALAILAMEVLRLSGMVDEKPTDGQSGNG